MGRVKKNIELTKEQKEAAKEHRKKSNSESQRLYRSKIRANAYIDQKS